MRKFLVLLLVFVASICAQAQTSTTGQGTLTQQGVAPQDVLAVFQTLSATGNTPSVSTVGTPLKPAGSNPGIIYLYTPKYTTIQAAVVGSPATCTYHVWGSLKTPVDSPSFPTDYQDLTGALDCTNATYQMVHLAYKPVASIVVQLSALTGGTSPTVQFRVLAVH